MYEAPKEGQTRTPKAHYYVSNANGLVYPAQKGLPGFEDDNPADWRVATADEVERFKQGKQPARSVPVEPVALNTPSSVATPATLQLAPDDTSVAAPESPVDGDVLDPPPLPPGAVPPTLPAFKLPE